MLEPLINKILQGVCLCVFFVLPLLFLPRLFHTSVEVEVNLEKTDSNANNLHPQKGKLPVSNEIQLTLPYG